MDDANTGVDRRNTGVEVAVAEDEDDDGSSEPDAHDTEYDTEYDRFQVAERAGREGADREEELPSRNRTANNDKQCTVGWHVDDLKISHADKEAVENIVSALQEKYGQESPLTVNRGDIHVYLGMTIDFSDPGKVVVSMYQYIEAIIADCPED